MIQNINYSGERVETDVVKFGDDWPGFFYRGNDCMAIADVLGRILNDKNNKLTLCTKVFLLRIKEELESAIQHKEDAGAAQKSSSKA